VDLRHLNMFCRDFPMKYETLTDAQHLQAGQLHVLVRPSGRLLCPGDHLQRQGLFHCQREWPALAPRKFDHGMERISVPILHTDASR